jgi:preprotein translocase subunit SecA
MLTYIKNTLDRQQQQLKKYQKLVAQINHLEPEMETLSDTALKEKTVYFKEQLIQGKTIDDIKVEAFAVVREASKRVLGLRHYDVQLLGGLVLADGNIPEMVKEKHLSQHYQAIFLHLRGKVFTLLPLTNISQPAIKKRWGKFMNF